MSAQFTVKIISPTTKHAQPYTEVAIIDGLSKQVPQREKLMLKEYGWLYTAGVGPCLAIAMFNTGSNAVSLCHLDNPYNEPKRADKINSEWVDFLNDMYYQIMETEPTGAINIFVCRGNAKDDNLLAAVNDWCKSTKSNNVGVSINIFQPFKNGVDDVILIDTEGKTLYLIQQKKFDVTHAKLTGILSGKFSITTGAEIL